MNNQPYIILVQPQLAENVGMTARAMMNCGLYNLCLVSPREDHLSAKAVAAASGAEEILQIAQIFHLVSGAGRMKRQPLFKVKSAFDIHR